MAHLHTREHIVSPLLDKLALRVDTTKLRLETVTDRDDRYKLLDKCLKASAAYWEEYNRITGIRTMTEDEAASYYREHGYGNSE